MSLKEKWLTGKPEDYGHRRKSVDSKRKSDEVNHPSHYSGAIECIDAMTQTQGISATQNFCICNAFKYLWRWRHKGGMQDVEKAAWYLNRAIDLERELDKWSGRLALGAARNGR